MNILKQSTAATIKLGPFVDDTDGKTAETALTIGQADIRLSKNGGDITQTNNATGATHDELGYYDIPLDTTDTGTLGRLRVLVSKAGALPVWQDFVVVTANVYDSMFSTDKLDVAVVEMATAIRDGLPEDIWSSSKRTLTQSPAEIIATVLGADITQIRGNSWAVQLTGVELGSIQQLAIKHSAKQSDSAALLFVDSVNGLTVLNGVTQDGEDSSKASLTYDGTILTLTVDASITAQLPAGSLKYGIQSISNNGIVSEPYGGTFRVLADIVRATD